MKDSKEFWDKCAEKYIKRPIKNEALYQQKIAITQEYLKSDFNMLEFGCGSGATAILHAPHVKDVIATDISDKMIEAAQKKATEVGIDNIVFQQGTLESMKFERERFDAVLGLNVLHLLDDVDGAISEVHRILKDDGVFISSTSLISEINLAFRFLISGMQFLGLAPHVSRFTRDQLIFTLQRSGFKVEKEYMASYESLFIVARKTVVKS
ncbi:class I SAM-dependent methyltransferase [Vibrio anguillarum]|uniref:Class I SAM-dependent methyltransferase n=3 Tax=Vibrio anguillarum TaxID=55601 RepID=A0AAW4BM22_VIBAN|nr:class I SAM-dependent methyltransferase [Vibrio anguillarum]MBF4246797.1 class I SAM-dependent methyltransferase [Vibrio anguillarum]MBF4279356.1 class I SAM-dependent methyltransferase [Vibrio anguillarum]MBF4364072.1 class I SAM-dependent methyltransferase [Vibrio anguillarum]MBF4375221.1 class I SAM-dependent methyltransferase [Vibrio anguillarum]MBF4438027.1 class I SAM-dependent methyltransferase [Vibrio anguillarum]